MPTRDQFSTPLDTRSLHIMPENPPDAIRMFPHDFRHPGHRHLSAQLQHQHLKQQGKAASRPGPGHLHLSNPASSTPHPGDSGMKIGLVLKKVEMPPGSILRIVNLAFFLRARRTRKLSPLGKINLQVQPTFFFGKPDIDHMPWLGQAQSHRRKRQFIHPDDSFQLRLHLESYHVSMP
jgi:hypothetical protein